MAVRRAQHVQPARRAGMPAASARRSSTRHEPVLGDRDQRRRHADVRRGRRAAGRSIRTGAGTRSASVRCDVARAAVVEVVLGARQRTRRRRRRRRGVEALGEFLRRAVAQHRQLARQRQALRFVALQLRRARRRCRCSARHALAIRMRAMRAADRDQRAQRARVPRGELQADHRAVGAADEGVRGVSMPSASSTAAMRVGLVGGVDRRIERAVGAEPVDGEQRDARGSSARRAPTCASHQPRFGNARAGRDMAIARRCRRRRARPAHARVAAHFVARGARGARRHGAGRGRATNSPRAHAACGATRSQTARRGTATAGGVAAADAVARLIGGIRWGRAIEHPRVTSEPHVAPAHGAIATIFRWAPGAPAGFGTHAGRLRDPWVAPASRACPSAGLDGWRAGCRRFPRLSIASCG